MQPHLEFRGDFDIQPKTMLAPGNWYLGFRCQSCGRGVAFLDDPTGAGELAISGDARLRASCPACGEFSTFGTSGVKVFQSPIGGATAPEEAVS